VGPLQHGELLHKSRMAVFPRHTRANECCQFAGQRLAGLSQGRSRITGILPDLADFYAQELCAKTSAWLIN
jgi:hypothetical protein